MWFSKNCNDCINCFGCVNLRKKNYYIWNVPYTKEEYFKKLEEFNLNSRKSLKQWRKKAEAFWATYPRKYYLGDSMNINVSGDIVYESKNTHDAFMVVGAENTRYAQFITITGARDCYDYTGWGDSSELLYEDFIVGSGANNVRFSAECWPQAFNTEYSYFCVNAPKNCFGCINTNRAEYCILNKQYTKEEYEKLKKEIIANMDSSPYISKSGHVYKYGEFLPPELSPFGYNETIAHEYIPQNENDAKQKGFNYFNMDNKVHVFTLSVDNIPDTSEEVNFDISSEVLECAECHNGFNISRVEVERLQKLRLPYPDVCWKCRHNRRFERSPKPFLYDRQCDKCGKGVKTSYKPGRPEIIYCESCYQQEVM